MFSSIIATYDALSGASAAAAAVAPVPEEDDPFDDDEDDPSLDPVDVEHQMVAPPSNRQYVITSIIAKGATVAALQPLSNACTYAILNDRNVGFMVMVSLGLEILVTHL